MERKNKTEDTIFLVLLIIFLVSLLLVSSTLRGQQYKPLDLKIEVSQELRFFAFTSALSASAFYSAYTLTNSFESQYIVSDKYGHWWVLYTATETAFFLTNKLWVGWALGGTMMLAKELYDYKVGGTGFSTADIQAGLSGVIFAHIVYKIGH